MDSQEAIAEIGTKTPDELKALMYMVASLIQNQVTFSRVLAGPQYAPVKVRLIAAADNLRFIAQDIHHITQEIFTTCES